MNDGINNQLLKDALRHKAPAGFKHKVMQEVYKQPPYGVGLNNYTHVFDYWLAPVIAIAGAVFVLLMYYSQALPDFSDVNYFALFKSGLVSLAGSVNTLFIAIIAIAFWILIDKLTQWIAHKKLMQH